MCVPYAFMGGGRGVGNPRSSVINHRRCCFPHERLIRVTEERGRETVGSGLGLNKSSGLWHCADHGGCGWRQGEKILGKFDLVLHT